LTAINLHSPLLNLHHPFQHLSVSDIGTLSSTGTKHPQYIFIFSIFCTLLLTITPTQSFSFSVEPLLRFHSMDPIKAIQNPHFVQLTGADTWQKWKSDIQVVLELNDTWLYVCGKESVPTEKDGGRIPQAKAQGCGILPQNYLQQGK
jgi:hypothetical protein